MLNRCLCIALPILGLAVIGLNSASAAGHGGRGSFSGGAGAVGFRTGNGNCWGNSNQFLRAENGIFAPPAVYGNNCWGYGGIGCGLGYGCGYTGWGWGCSPLLLGCQPLDVPYYALFPPVYYGYTDHAPILNPTFRSSWATAGSAQPSQDSAASASPPRSPLRIANPYYQEEKAD
jgi:hypothetical protein